MHDYCTTPPPFENDELVFKAKPQWNQQFTENATWVFILSAISDLISLAVLH